jgi:hypothetical protein
MHVTFTRVHKIVKELELVVLVLNYCVEVCGHEFESVHTLQTFVWKLKRLVTQIPLSVFSRNI